MRPTPRRLTALAPVLAAMLGATPAPARHAPSLTFTVEDGAVIVQFADTFELIDLELVVSAAPEAPIAVLDADSVVASEAGQAAVFILPEAAVAATTDWLILELMYDDPDDREPRRWRSVAYFACQQGKCDRATSVAWQVAHGLLTREEDPSGRVVYDAPAAAVKTDDAEGER